VIRLLLALLVIAGLVWVAVLFAEEPGTLSLQWAGWQVQTSVAVLVLAVVTLIVLILLLLRLVGAILRAPRAFL